VGIIMVHPCQNPIVPSRNVRNVTATLDKLTVVLEVLDETGRYRAISLSADTKIMWRGTQIPLGTAVALMLDEPDLVVSILGNVVSFQ
jgi:hypothetical protein